MFRSRQKPQPEVRDPLSWHVDFIVALARVLRPALYVELGVHRAELFNLMVPYAGRLVGVDVDERSRDFVVADPKVRFVCASTERFVEELQASAPAIDLLFIDADHSREAVVRDFRAYFPFVRPHGLILLHDTHPGSPDLVSPDWCGDAYLAIDDLRRDDDGYELMTIPVSPGLTLCRKRTAQLSWYEQEPG